MTKTLVQFIGLWLGRYAIAPGGAGGQCVDLANLWVAQGLGLPPVRADAADWPTVAPREVWRWEPNTPRGVPPAGALVVWRANDPWAGTGMAGHIGIATPLADANDLVTFDQDWPWGATPQLVLHRGYLGVAGWLFPRQGVAGAQGKGATQGVEVDDSGP